MEFEDPDDDNDQDYVYGGIAEHDAEEDRLAWQLHD